MPSFALETSRIEARARWPESWRISHHHDDVEIWRGTSDRGYAKMYDQRRRRVLDALRSVASPGAKLLDLAAAQGNYTLAAAAMGYHITGNDPRADLVDYVKLKSPLAERIEFVPGNIFELGDRFAGAFDVALALEVVEHVAHPDQFLAQLATVVKPGGHLIISTPNGGYFLNRLPRFSDCPDASIYEDQQFKPDSDGHIFLLHQDEIATLSKRAGLELVRHEMFTNPLSAGHAKTARLHRILPGALIGAVEGVTAMLPSALTRKLSAASVTILRRPS
ncbi:methyltransferase domain-containing protein [Sphingomonas sp. So64.6b]|uniref:class I SAM-dependent methyltransferase n=1 Tax=Sphingomonas sp. So64.6b TaxID=2997354 RepID=UPI0015FF2B5A|nr:methyltransferase domain-containing protein [Sphingomonas sp. So64.6b]QNA83235.1 methyltransferase domain-containing protein [Sphingomonas sp. So64.6b]